MQELPSNLQEPMHPEKVLVVDDDSEYRELLKRFVSRNGWDCDTAVDGLEAIIAMKRHSYGVVVTDMMMPTMDGMTLLRHCRKHFPTTDVIVLTGFNKDFTFMDVISAGAVDFMEKPVSQDEFKAKLNRVFRERRLHAGYIQEIKTRREAEAGLQVALKVAKESNRVKDRFLANMSHEMRTPLNGIVGFSQLLLAGELTQEMREHLHIINASALHLQRLVNDVFDFSSLQSGGPRIEEKPFTLGEALVESFSPFKNIADDKGVEFSWELDPKLPDTLIGDRSRLVSVLRHLSSNAVKFTRQGEVRILINQQRRKDNRIWVEFLFSDSGIGIPDGREKEIFLPFHQLDGSSTRRFDGAGLGLSLTAGIVNLLGGEIWLEKQPVGQAPPGATELGGSIFHVELPFQVDLPAMQADIPQRSAPPATGLHHTLLH